MIKTTTPNEVILNVYQESSETSQEDFRIECLLNSILAQEKEELEEVKQALEAMAYSPSASKLDAILAYSKSFMTNQ